MVQNSEYWKRRNDEKQWMLDNIKRDKDFSKEITAIYKNALDDIQDALERELNLLASSENVSMADAMRTIKQTDVEKFSRTAKRMVEERDFSPTANKQLRRYNVTMRSNRLELMRAYINLNVTALAGAEEKLTTEYLTKEAEAELIRQAGILAEVVPGQKYLKRATQAIVEGDFIGDNYSHRLWNNGAYMANDLDNAMRKVLIQGKNPRAAARDLRKHAKEAVMVSAKKNAERLAITESARVQTGAQKLNYEEYGIEEYEYIAEPTACSICRALDGKIFKVVDMEPGKNAAPKHPRCHCSSGAVSERGN